MTQQNQTAEVRLARAERRWKWLRFFRLTTALLSAGIFILLGLGGAIMAGWLQSRALAETILTAVVAAMLVFWVGLFLAVMARRLDRSKLAAALEQADRRLQDRLNTLLFLQSRRSGAHSAGFASRIARQIQSLGRNRSAGKPFSSAGAVGWGIAVAALVVGTLALNLTYDPWSRLRAPVRANAGGPNPNGERVEFKVPPPNQAEQSPDWGEVRIVQPGGDLKVTKVDVVPLQIEAAASQPIQAVNWFSTVNGAAEAAHELPPPPDPRYAAYEPVLYLDELRLADWDVVTYYAAAKTANQSRHASEVYFLEVRPFREDILKMPGGAGGKPYQTLNEISTLIHRQQQIIRQTHQHLQRPPAEEALRNQDRSKLAKAEGEQRDTARHLYARLAAEMENQPIGEALDSLAQAEHSLDAASRLLEENVMGEAQNQERRALSELVAARKIFQKAVSDNPEAFAEGTGGSAEDEPSPTAETKRKLDKMAEFRDEAKAAQDFVQKTGEEQGELSREAQAGEPGQRSNLADRQDQLGKSFQEFRHQHPQAFSGVEDPSGAASRAMDQASQALRRGDDTAAASTREAGEKLKELAQAMQRQAAGQQLADGYRLRQMLDRQMQEFDEWSRPDSQSSREEVAQTAREARQTLEELQKAAETEPGRQALGEALREALKDPDKSKWRAILDQLAKEQDAAARRSQAGQAKAALEAVGRAFDESLPHPVQTARQSDALDAGQQGSFSRGLSALDSLSKRLRENRPLSAEDQRKQEQEALAHLQAGLRNEFGNSEAGQQLLQELESLLASSGRGNPEELQKLLQQLARFSSEGTIQRSRGGDPAEVANLDASRLPAAYRGRIQKYFEKLSERQGSDQGTN
jgi:hypothetical protein